jgi:hypothetical protein
VDRSKEDRHSAAVVFLPQKTHDFGKHGSDRCYCIDMYGEIPLWGCKWFELWRQHIQKAVRLKQRLQVYYALSLSPLLPISPPPSLTHLSSPPLLSPSIPPISPISPTLSPQVYYAEGLVGCGKIESWEECWSDAIKRDSFRRRQSAFLQRLPGEAPSKASAVQ